MQIHYQEIPPGPRLKDYVKCYYVYESLSAEAVEDVAFASGCIEVMFNLGSGCWQTRFDGNFHDTPGMEVWGQVIEPLAFRTVGHNIMLGIRFLPHAASLFLRDDVSQLNGMVTDLDAIVCAMVRGLHARLLDTPLLSQRIALLEEFLLSRLKISDTHKRNIGIVQRVMRELTKSDYFDNISNVASQHGISARHLQKLFVTYTGLAPKLYSKIHRFQNSLLLVAAGDVSLTSVAYECGYFDQSHFIREFRFFAGVTPSSYMPQNSSAVLASPNK